MSSVLPRRNSKAKAWKSKIPHTKETTKLILWEMGFHNQSFLRESEFRKTAKILPFKIKKQTQYEMYGIKESMPLP